MQFHFLLSPLYFVLYFLMKSSSLSFLISGSELKTFSRMVTLISLTSVLGYYNVPQWLLSEDKNWSPGCHTFLHSGQGFTSWDTFGFFNGGAD